ncbi:MAG: rubredoxin [Bacteroidales bacterium]|nr:rubredoxin [Bacteroidales bacterium]
MKYICTICGHEYDEAAEGVPFNELPEDWVCPVCGVGKELFKPEQ